MTLKKVNVNNFKRFLFKLTSESYAALIYLITLLLVLFLPPFFSDMIIAETLVDITVTLNLLGSLLILKKTRVYKIYLVIVILSITTTWLSEVVPAVAELASRITYIFVTLSMILIVFGRVFSEKNVDQHTLFYAITGYVAVGIVFTFLFVILNQSENTNTFNKVLNSNNTFSELVYFSFVTQTSLGYGDLAPVSDKAKSLSVLLVLSGQIYLTVILAIIVGKFASKKH